MARVRPIRQALIALALLVSTPAFAEPNFATEKKFHDLFVTAGYSTAFGAALGAAFLGLTENPNDNLDYIAFGASLGFIGGSVLGTYIAFAPIITYDPPRSTNSIGLQTRGERRLGGQMEVTLASF